MFVYVRSRSQNTRDISSRASENGMRRIRGQQVADTRLFLQFELFEMVDRSFNLPTVHDSILLFSIPSQKR